MWRAIIVAVIGAAAGAALTWWLNSVYYQPKLEYFTRGYYYTIGSERFGNVLIWNTGHQAATNVALTLDESVDPRDVEVLDASAPYRVNNIGNKTVIALERLQPSENVDVTFRTRNQQEEFRFFNLTSDSGLAKPVFLKGQWWEVWREQALLLGLISLGLVGSGYYWGRRNPDEIHRRLRLLLHSVERSADDKVAS